MDTFPKVKPTLMSLPSRISWSLLPCSTHSPLALQTSGILNHVVYATNSGCPKPRAKSTGCIKPRTHTQPINCNFTPQKDTMIPSMAQTRHPLNNQIIAIFSPSTTRPATLFRIPVFSTTWYTMVFYTFLHFWKVQRVNNYTIVIHTK